MSGGSVEGGRSGLEIGFAGRACAGFAGIFLALLWLALAASAAQAGTLLYPNLKPLSPRELRFDRTDVDAGSATVMHNVLRFSNTVWNTGPGPMEVRGSIDPITKAGPATQRVYDDSGGFTDFPAGSFYYHPAHGHYHYDNWGRYELWRKADYEAWLASGRTVGNPAVGAKTTSCMMDEEFIRNVPNQPYPPVYESEGCFPDSNGNMRQGISPGWGDTYDYFRFEQWIDLGPSGSLADGEYVLRTVVDPTNKIYESPNKADPLEEGEEDNEAITPFSVHNGQLVDSNPPNGSIRVNNIDATTSTPNVGVKVLGRDDISGVTEVRLSNDGNSWTAPIAYTGKESATQYIEWNLTDPAYGGNGFDGTKTVYAEFEDAAGNWSAPESDSIVLDRGGGSSAYSNAVEGDYPTGYWRLAEKSGTIANDVAGSNPGTYENGTMLDQPSLLPGDLANGSARFDGSNDYVGIPSSPPLSPSGKVSVEAWVKPDALPSKDNFVSIASKPDSYSLQFDGPDLEFTIMQSGARKRLQAPPGTVTVGQAYHVVGTYDGTAQRLYVNGAEVASAPLSGAITTNSKELDIGSWSEGSEAFDGAIDEVAVYAGALSAARVATHWQAGSGQAPPDTTVKDPSNLVATAASETQIDLKWADNSDNEGEFLIQRDTSPTFSAPVILPVWANSTSFSDTGLAPGTTYYYRVRARNATDSSNYSNTANATTLSPVPAPAQVTGSGGQSPRAATPPTTGSGSAGFRAPGYAAVVMDDDPSAYWRLDEKSGWQALDVEGANPGTYWGNPRLGVAGLPSADVADASVRFDGVDDYVEVPSSPSLSPDRVSVEAWVEAAELPRRGHVAVIAGKPGSYSLGLSGPQLEFTVWLAGRALRLRAPAGAIEARRVEHLVGVYDGSALRLFVNGTRVATTRRAGAIAVGGRPFEIGSGGGSWRAFKGGIDEVAVYGKALTGSQVAAHYRAGTLPRSRTARRSRAALVSRYAPVSVIPAYCHLWAAGANTAITITTPPWLRPQT